MLFCGPVYAGGAALDINAKSAILLEQSTGEVLFEENADERLPIASVTKIMTMLLIMEDMDKGVFTMEDMVPVSERAMAMGGSTMFLEAGEELSVYEILKGIVVASANDGTVAIKCESQTEGNVYIFDAVSGRTARTIKTAEPYDKLLGVLKDGSVITQKAGQNLFYRYDEGSDTPKQIKTATQWTNW